MKNPVFFYSLDFYHKLMSTIQLNSVFEHYLRKSLILSSNTILMSIILFLIKSSLYCLSLF